MYLIIELHDHVGVVHDLFNYDSEDSQVTMDALREKVQSVFVIKPTYQQLFHNGTSLFDNWESIELKNGDIIIAKHSLLGLWSAYLLICESAINMNEVKSARIILAHQAIENSKVLEDSGLLTVYSDFSRDWIETISQMSRLVDTTQDDFEQSATTFFSKMYPISKIEFEPKPGGTRAGIVVKVTHNDEETKYYMKTYHRAGSSPTFRNRTKKQLPDLREMFAYRLLELIGVGPLVLFPYGPEESKYIAYIATKEVDEFKELNKIEDVSVQNKIVVETYLLSMILGMRDLHEENIGINKEKNLSIIDFYVSSPGIYERHKIIDDFKNKSFVCRDATKAVEILAEIGQEERMRIAKDALPNWSQISSMTNDIIGVEINELGEHGMRIANIKNYVDSYLEEIESNYTSICSAFL